MVANKGIICTKIGCRFDEKHQMRQPQPCYKITVNKVCKKTVNQRQYLADDEQACEVKA